MIDIPTLGDLVRNNSGSVFLIVDKNEDNFLGNMFDIMLESTGEIFKISESKLNTNFSKVPNPACKPS